MKNLSNIEEILDFAISNEQGAVDFYTKLAAKASSEAMKTMFTEFAGEEMGHKAKLLEVKETGIFEKSFENFLDLKISDYVVKVPSGPDMTYNDALVLAMNREKASFRLYTRLAEKSSDSSLRDLFRMLAQEEAKHKLRFEIEYDEYVLKDN